MKFVEQLLGVGLILFILTDVFLTVLYARADTGLLSRHLTHGVFTIFRGISRTQDTQKGKLLAFAGPIILVWLVIVWVFGLTGVRRW